MDLSMISNFETENIQFTEKKQSQKVPKSWNWSPSIYDY